MPPPWGNSIPIGAAHTDVREPHILPVKFHSMPSVEVNLKHKNMIASPHFLNANMYIPPSQEDYVPSNNTKLGSVTVIRD